MDAALTGTASRPDGGGGPHAAPRPGNWFLTTKIDRSAEVSVRTGNLGKAVAGSESITRRRLKKGLQPRSAERCTVSIANDA